jgi:hypothetical protein
MTTKTKRYDMNPFVSNLDLKIGTKSVRISALGKDNNILIDQTSGEVSGTHVVARKKVDTESFVKTFANYMSFTFDLSKAGNKALRVVMWGLSKTAINKDMVVLDKFTLIDFIKDNGHIELSLSYPTFMRGLSELESSKIIAKSLRAGTYYINPNVMFNGDRIAFTTVIERDKASERIES